MLLKARTKGQTLVEYIVLLIIVMGALLAIGNYFKRGLQGRWKTAVDDLGDQYDPRAADGSVRHTLQSNTITSILTENGTGGYWTWRTDDTVSVETRTGNMTIGAY